MDLRFKIGYALVVFIILAVCLRAPRFIPRHDCGCNKKIDSLSLDNEIMRDCLIREQMKVRFGDNIKY